jgi:hypothetical protein
MTISYCFLRNRNEREISYRINEVCLDVLFKLVSIAKIEARKARLLGSGIAQTYCQTSFAGDL